MSEFRGQSGWVANLIVRMEQALAQLAKLRDDGGRLRGTPDNVVGVFPSEASEVVYDPTTPADWSSPPTEVKTALDDLATAVNSIVTDASGVSYTPANNTDWSGSADPGNVDDALDQLVSRVTGVEAAGSGGLSTMLSDPTSATWIDQPAALTELFGGTNNRTKIDLTDAKTVRLVVDVQAVGVAGAKLRGQYSTDESTWAYLDGATGPECAIDATGTIASVVVNLEAGAQADVWVRVVGISGDGAADPAFGLIQLQFDTLRGAGGGGLDNAHAWLGSDFFAENPPASPTVYDDEFDDTSGNSGAVNGLDARWTWRNQSTATATFPRAGYITITPPASSGVNWRIIEQTLPGGNWTFEAKVSLECVVSNYVQGGIALIDGVNGDLYTFQLDRRATNAIQVQFARWTSVTAYQGTSPVALFSWPHSYAYMRVTMTGTTLTCWISDDGIGWIRVGSFTDAVGVTKIGLGVDEENNTGLTKLHCSYFRRTA